MKTNKEIIKQFDKHFTRDDGLINKYSYYGVEDDPSPQPTPKAIKMFILKALSNQRKEIIEKLRENCLEYDGKWHMKGKDSDCKKFTMKDLINIIKE